MSIKIFGFGFLQELKFNFCVPIYGLIHYFHLLKEGLINTTKDNSIH